MEILGFEIGKAKDMAEPAWMTGWLTLPKMFDACEGLGRITKIVSGRKAFLSLYEVIVSHGTAAYGPNSGNPLKHEFRWDDVPCLLDEAMPTGTLVLTCENGLATLEGIHR